MGLAERTNKTLMESARAMINHASLSNSYWAEAVATAAYLKNRSSPSGNTTPYQKWFERKPDVSHLRVFGCIAYVHILNCDRQKKVKKLRFVGYCKNSKGYRLFDEETRKVLKRRDVIFDETVFVFNKPVTEQKNTIFDVGSVLEPSEEETHQPQDDTEQPQDEPQDDTQQSEERRRSQRARGPPVRFGVDEFATQQKLIIWHM